MASAKRKIGTVLIFVFTICLGLFCFRYHTKIDFSLKEHITLDEPYLVRDYGNLRYILDKQRTRVLVIDKNSNEIQQVLPENSGDADTFYSADDFLVDENSFVYVKEGSWDGNRIGREALLVYDSEGNYYKTYLDTTYSSLVNKHKIMLLSIKNGILLYAVKEKSSINVISLDLSSGAEEKKEYPFENAFDFVNDMTQDKDGNIYVLDKPGHLFLLGENSKIKLLYTATTDEFPNWIESAGPGKILFADLYYDCVRELDLASGQKRLVVNHSGAVTVTPEAFSNIENPRKNKNMILMQMLVHAVFFLFVFFTFVCLIITIVLFFKSKMHIIRRITVYVVIIVISVAFAITYKLTDGFSRIMKNQILAQMENMAYSVANTLKPATLDSIDTAADFASPEYREMIASMESVIDPNLEVNRNVYCDIFKLDEKRGAYSCAYLDQTIGTFFPLSPSETEEIKQIYESGQAMRSSKDDTSASYTYVSVPVKNDERHVCGVVSVMMESIVLTNQINEMRKNVLFGLVITLIFIWLIMGEALSYIISKSQAQMEMEEKRARGEKTEKTFPYYYIRLMVFVLFASYNMTTTFIPMVVVKGALNTLGEDVSGFISALPLSINLFAIGLMALFCEKMIRRWGCKKILVSGTILSAVSNLIMFAFPSSYFLLFLALTLDGIGVGLSTNSMYLMVSQIPEAKNRTAGYAAYNAAQISGINFGMLFGAALVSNIGRQFIFPIVSLMWGITAFVFVFLWKSLKVGAHASESENLINKKINNTPKTILTFLFRRRIWSFILLVQAPFALMASFVYYYLPIYSDEKGMSEIIVAVLMMLYSMFAIYLGNGLTRFVMERTKSFSHYAATILCALAVIIYAFMGNFTGLLIAIFILGFSNGFGRSALQSNFSMLDECGEFGIPEAMGIFNFTDFIGQSFGPTVMAMVFLSGNIKVSATIFAIIMFCFSILHVTIDLSKVRK